MDGDEIRIPQGHRLFNESTSEVVQLQLIHHCLACDDAGFCWTQLKDDK